MCFCKAVSETVLCNSDLSGGKKVPDRTSCAGGCMVWGHGTTGQTDLEYLNKVFNDGFWKCHFDWTEVRWGWETLKVKQMTGCNRFWVMCSSLLYCQTHTHTHTSVKPLDIQMSPQPSRSNATLVGLKLQLRRDLVIPHVNGQCVIWSGEVGVNLGCNACWWDKVCLFSPSNAVS